MGASGTTTLAFGATAVTQASVNVTGQASIASDSEVEGWVMRSSTAGNNAEMHELLAFHFEITVGDIVAGTGFTIKAQSRYDVKASGDFTIAWAWN